MKHRPPATEWDENIPLIPNDFMQEDGNRVVLTPRGTFDELWWGSVPLREGIRVRLFAQDQDFAGELDELVAEGTAAYDSDTGEWVVMLDVDGIRHRSEYAHRKSHWVHSIDWTAVAARVDVISKLMLAQDRPHYVDLNYSAPSDDGKTIHVYLEKSGVSYLDRAEIEPIEGKMLQLYSDDADQQRRPDYIVFEGVLVRSHDRGWKIVAKTDDLKHVSEVANQTDHWANSVDWRAIHKEER